MTKHTFFTRSPELAFLWKLVVENSNRDYQRADSKRLFDAVDAYCADHLPTVDRGGWLGPLIVGGALISHTEPHIISAVFAINADLAAGLVKPVPYLSSRLNMNGATAVKFEPPDQLLLMDYKRESAPLTDILMIIPAKPREKWVNDLYGIPRLNSGVTAIGWHAASESHFTAMCGGMLLLHLESNTILNPMAVFTEEEEQLFFGEPVDQLRLARHRERLVDFFGIPPDVRGHNYETARQVVKAYLDRYPIKSVGCREVPSCSRSPN